MMIRDSAGNQYCDDVLSKPLDQFQIEPDPLNLVAIGPGIVEKATATNGKKVVARFPNSIEVERILLNP